jgi:sec-independent protein translocase protein TatB
VFNVGAPEVLVIMLVALVVLGPNKMPEAARQAGKWLAEFRKVSQGFQREMRAAMDEVSEPVRSTHAFLKDGGESEPPAAPAAPAPAESGPAPSASGGPSLDKAAPPSSASSAPASSSSASAEPTTPPGGQSWLAKPGDAAPAGDAPA